ncbi:TIGR03557 family F420-dependent LLM class oxidoreductase [Nocardioides piscis]|uniref:TIGR03557 family F420-dependent LLM class oxidoreductase n=1 Tax=Nocardioides piscis TaxID=2714938 RepID=A0A6G7YD92_9ACTN|nr:TIGR03557 family F420-dependent LLM class oxidoreductase [Nocardioides piscis]QIK74763.1 TIGR03557 family F420-dependent LLM class oxidoreductase [Nocardioides piscis]
MDEQRQSPTRFGYFLSSEEYTPAQLVEQAKLAQEAGFEALWISDHFHPWNDEQGQSPFVWSVIGAIAEATDLPVTTAVTCPTYRIHPAVIAQAAATSAVMLEGRFTLGLGSGEALNEHILGQAWPTAQKRLDMLEEAVDVIRQLFTGEVVRHEGRYYTVDTARIYTLPDEPPPIYISGFGPHATDLAARIGDGYVTTSPDTELLERFRKGSGGKPAQIGQKVSWAATRDEGVDIAHRLWANSGLPGELAQVLPSPQHFEQASELVTKEMTADSVPCGSDVETHVEGLRAAVEAGFDEVYVANMGPNYAEMITTYGAEVLPALREIAAS